MKRKKYTKSKKNNIALKKAREALTPEVIARRAKTAKKTMNTPEMKKKMSIINKKNNETMSEETKKVKAEKCRQAAIKQWANKTAEERKEHGIKSDVRKAQDASRRTTESSIEVAVKNVLSILGIEYIESYRIGPYTADIYIPHRELVMECDGDYWHGTKEAKLHDAKRDQYMRERGFNVVRLQEHRIRKQPAVATLSALGFEHKSFNKEAVCQTYLKTLN